MGERFLCLQMSSGTSTNSDRSSQLSCDILSRKRVWDSVESYSDFLGFMRNSHIHFF